MKMEISHETIKTVIRNVVEPLIRYDPGAVLEIMESIRDAVLRQTIVVRYEPVREEKRLTTWRAIFKIVEETCKSLKRLNGEPVD